MARSKNSKNARGSRGFRPTVVDGTILYPAGSSACDMMVMLPKEDRKVHSQLKVREILTRLASTGFTHMALTHTIYGRPKNPDDRADVAIPKSLWSSQTSNIESTGKGEPVKKKRKLDANAAHGENSPSSPIRVLRRICAVLENLSDVGLYVANGQQASLFNEYDLVSVSPRNDATFQAACTSASIADIITLDYTTRGLRLPYKIRPTDVQAVVDRQAAFEIPFAPALLNIKLRKALVQTCCELQTSSLGKKPLILFSSGDRTFEGSDVGAMALRLPGDLSNLLQSLLHFDPKTSISAVGRSGIAVLKRADDRRWGRTNVTNITFTSRLEDDVLVKKKSKDFKKLEEVGNLNSSVASKHEAKEDGSSGSEVEDGFISMS